MLEYGFISLPIKLLLFFNPEIPGEKRAKAGRLGGWGAGGRAIWLVALLLSMFFSRMQPLIVDQGQD